jgi:hypothetical protein
LYASLGSRARAFAGRSARRYGRPRVVDSQRLTARRHWSKRETAPRKEFPATGWLDPAAHGGWIFTCYERVID